MKSDAVYLQHISDAIQKIESYTAVGHDVFMTTSHWQDATIRQLEIIGEAVKRLSPGFRQKYPEVPWRRIGGFRDVLIHDYLGVDISKVWKVTQNALPELKQYVEMILAGEA